MPEEVHPLVAELRWLRRGVGVTVPKLGQCPQLLARLGCVTRRAEGVALLKNRIDRLDHHSAELLRVAYGYDSRGSGAGVQRRRGSDKDSSGWVRAENHAIDALVEVLLECAASPRRTVNEDSSLNTLEVQPAPDLGPPNYHVSNNVTIWTYDSRGNVQLRLLRQLRSLTDGLRTIPEFYSGSGDSRIKYRFVAEFGCTVGYSRVGPNGNVDASLELTRTLNSGDSHTIIYRIERDPNDGCLESERLRPYIQCTYSPFEPTDREVCIIQFAPGRVPSEIWVDAGITAARVGSYSPDLLRLVADGQRCVQHEFRNLAPNVIYAVCWVWPDQALNVQ